MLQQLEQQIEKLLQPISEGDPCGEDPKYEDAYDQLKQEIAKMGGMGVGSTDWEKVESGAVDLLSTTSKELNLCVFLASAWTVRHQFDGMIAGMELVTRMVTSYWENMYPPIKRLKPRKGAFSWLQERLVSEVEKCKSADREQIERGIKASVSLKEAIYERFDDPPCNFRKLKDTFEEWLMQVPQPAAEPEPQPEAPAPEPVAQPTPEPATAVTPEPSAPAPAVSTPAPQPAAPPPRTTQPVEVPDLSDDADAEQLMEVLAKIANQLRGLAANSETPYLLLRKALWETANEPRSEASGETFFPAPPDEMVNALNNMYKLASWQDLLERAEDLTYQRWYWLDLQYFAVEAAEKLGWEQVASSIATATWHLDQKLPGLKELKFNDGKPFAGSTTKDWLAKLKPAGVGGGESTGEAVEVDPGETLISELRGKGSEAFGEAMALAQETLESAPNRRVAMMLRLETATWCMEVDQAEWAARLLEGMIEEMEAHQLSWWEPRLAGKIWTLMYEAARRLAPDDDHYRPWVRRAMNGMAAADLTRVGRFPEKPESGP